MLERAGYDVRQPRLAGRPPCCGRTFLNVGLIDEARVELDRTTRAFAPFIDRGVPIVGLEPSCLLTLRDELPAEGERIERYIDRFEPTPLEPGEVCNDNFCRIPPSP